MTPLETESVIVGDVNIDVLTSAIVTFEPNDGFSNITGYAQFEQLITGTRMFGQVSGLSPGLHGTHVHTKGDLR